MEQVLSSGSSMITEASGNAREIAEQIGAQPTLEGLIVTGIVGLLICFFGLKLIRLQAALVGFLMGALIGIGVAWTAGISGLTFAIVVFACGAVLAALSFFLYKFGVFCVVFCVCLGMGVQIADPQSTLPLVIVLVVAYGMFKKVDVFDEFIEGAKDGFLTVYKIMPTLIGLMIGVGILRESLAMDYLAAILAPVVKLFHFPGELLPLFIVKMFSSSAAIHWQGHCLLPLWERLPLCF